MRGTCGTIVAAGFALLMLYLDAGQAGWWIASGVFSLLSLAVGSCVLRRAGISRDPDWFVLDEAAGLFLTLSLLSAGTVLDIVAGFLVFRVYDIAKPWPVRAFERWPGSAGILTDDLAAAVFAAWTVWAFRAIAPGVI